jgi:hypothetical protein
MCESYWVNGRYHNPIGPAICEYNEFGRFTMKSYYLGGKNLSKSEWKFLTKPPEIFAAISRLPYPIAMEIKAHYRKE